MTPSARTLSGVNHKKYRGSMLYQREGSRERGFSKDIPDWAKTFKICHNLFV